MPTLPVVEPPLPRASVEPSWAGLDPPTLVRSGSVRTEQAFLGHCEHAEDVRVHVGATCSVALLLAAFVFRRARSRQDVVLVVDAGVLLRPHLPATSSGSQGAGGGGPQRHKVV